MTISKNLIKSDKSYTYADVWVFYLMENHQTYPYFEETIDNHEA